MSIKRSTKRNHQRAICFIRISSITGTCHVIPMFIEITAAFRCLSSSLHSTLTLKRYIGAIYTVEIYKTLDDIIANTAARLVTAEAV